MNYLPSKALSILQPWAWSIITPEVGKDIENRDWKPTNPGLRFRGRFLIHTGQGFDYDGYDHLRDVLPAEIVVRWPAAPLKTMFRRGGIVGAARIVDCVTAHSSEWFFGRYGFVLADVRPLAFVPCNGQLGFFTVPEDVLCQLRDTA